MGLLDRFTRAVRANLNDLLGSDDPDTLIGASISELENGAKDGKRDLLTSVATAKRLRGEADERQKEAAQWAERAALAVRKGEEDLAREALKQKLRLSKEADRLTAESASHDKAARELEKAIETMEQQAKELAARRSSLVAEVRAARAQDTRLASSASELSRATERVAALEAEVEAAQVLAPKREADLLQRFAELERSAEDSSVEDELRDLKKQLEP